MVIVVHEIKVVRFRSYHFNFLTELIQNISMNIINETINEPVNVRKLELTWDELKKFFTLSDPSMVLFFSWERGRMIEFSEADQAFFDYLGWGHQTMPVIIDDTIANACNNLRIFISDDCGDGIFQLNILFDGNNHLIADWMNCEFMSLESIKNYIQELFDSEEESYE